MAMLSRSLMRLATLPDNTKVYPGHGYATTIGEEKEYNPYM
jgi:glyoxylase-like metal-dependent hydrolase (beta-lactamase superfamily II)